MKLCVKEEREFKEAECPEEIKVLYEEALKAMRRYGGHGDGDDEY